MAARVTASKSTLAFEVISPARMTCRSLQSTSQATWLRGSCCHPGELSVWQEGREERELFQVNLGILAEIARRAKIAVRAYERSRKKDASELAPLTEAEVLPIWRACASDP